MTPHPRTHGPRRPAACHTQYRRGAKVGSLGSHWTATATLTQQAMPTLPTTNYYLTPYPTNSPNATPRRHINAPPHSHPTTHLVPNPLEPRGTLRPFTPPHPQPGRHTRHAPVQHPRASPAPARWPATCKIKAMANRKTPQPRRMRDPPPATVGPCRCWATWHHATTTGHIPYLKMNDDAT
jgi:hypothetical protein